MEEDTGKSLHVGGATGRIHGADYSLVDYNRAGIPLIEIVTKPVEGTGALAPRGRPRLRHRAARADALARRLRRAHGAGLAALRRQRVAAPVAVATRWAPGRRPRTSTRCARWSAPCATRSAGRRRVLTSGGRVVQETRHWHEDTGTTTSGRSKEQAEDYRYFPEPDLVPLAPDPAWVEELRAGLPEAPAVRRGELQEEWGVTDLEMQSLVNAGAVDLVESTVAAGAPADAARKWWLGELARHANERGVDLAELADHAGPGRASVVALVESGALNDKLARQVIEGVLAGEGDPDEVVAARGLAVVSDDSALLAAVDAALAAHPDVAEKIRGGKVAAAGAIVGAVMKATRGQADAARVRELVLERCGQA